MFIVIVSLFLLEYGNNLVTVDGKVYYYNDSDISSDTKYIAGYNGNLTAALTYYLYCYDSNGNLKAIEKLEF